MTCDSCQKDKADVMPRLAPQGSEKQDGKYCTVCCRRIFNRPWLGVEYLAAHPELAE